MSESIQILPNPNPKGNVIIIDNDRFNKTTLFENLGTIAVTKTGSLENQLGTISSGVEDGPAGPGGNVDEPGQIKILAHLSTMTLFILGKILQTMDRQSTIQIGIQVKMLAR